MKLQIVVYESTSGGENLMHKQRDSRLRLIRFCFANTFTAAAFWIFHEARSAASNEDAALFFMIKNAIAIKALCKKDLLTLVAAARVQVSAPTNVPQCSLTTDWRLAATRKSNELLIFLNKNKSGA